MPPACVVEWRCAKLGRVGEVGVWVSPGDRLTACGIGREDGGELGAVRVLTVVPP